MSSFAVAAFPLLLFPLVVPLSYPLVPFPALSDVLCRNMSSIVDRETRLASKVARLRT